MHGFPILPWLALVAVYVASGRMRGSSWTSLAATAGGVLAAVFLEFTLAFTLGLAGFASTMLVAAGVAASIVVGRRLRRPPPVLRSPTSLGRDQHLRLAFQIDIRLTAHVHRDPVDRPARERVRASPG